MSTTTRVTAGAFAVALAIGLATPAAFAEPAPLQRSGVTNFTNPNTIPATGTFTLTTAPGIVPAWEREAIVLTSIFPASVTGLSITATTRLTMPVVAKTGSANALSGGFRLTNSKTRASVRCVIPTLDTKARVLDCITDSNLNENLLSIDSIRSRTSQLVGTTRTTEFTGMEFRVASSDAAAALNKALSTTVFTTSVILATGELDVSWEATARN